MKNLYHKNNKGKVYPTPPSSNTDSVLSVLKFLPTTILALASILSLEDREVLAYLITRSLNTNPNSNSNSFSLEKKKCKKPITTSTSSSSSSSNHHHKFHPMFDCGCFDCYTSYWYRWDSSPNRELIHQVIEAFEDYLTNGELSKKKNNRGKKRDNKVFDKTSPTSKLLVNSDKADEKQEEEVEKEMVMPVVVLEMEMVEEKCVTVLPESEVFLTDVVNSDEEVPEKVAGSWIQSEESLQVVHKGLARKVLPDVMGLFNSRIWSLWSTNI